MRGFGDGLAFLDPESDDEGGGDSGGGVGLGGSSSGSRGRGGWVNSGSSGKLSTPRAHRTTLYAWAPCKCQAKGFESGGKLARRTKRAQDVLWAVPRAAADALFTTTQEYVDRGCKTSPFRDDPAPRWMKGGCGMHVDGRDHYECMFILRLARFNIGYGVYFPQPSPTQSLDDGGWKIVRPSWCTKHHAPGGSGGGGGRGGSALWAKNQQQNSGQQQQQHHHQNQAHHSHGLSGEFTLRRPNSAVDLGSRRPYSFPSGGSKLPPNWGENLPGYPHAPDAYTEKQQKQQQRQPQLTAPLAPEEVNLAVEEEATQQSSSADPTFGASPGSGRKKSLPRPNLASSFTSFSSSDSSGVASPSTSGRGSRSSSSSLSSSSGSSGGGWTASWDEARLRRTRSRRSLLSPGSKLPLLPPPPHDQGGSEVAPGAVPSSRLGAMSARLQQGEEEEEEEEEEKGEGVVEAPTSTKHQNRTLWAPKKGASGGAAKGAAGVKAADGVTRGRAWQARQRLKFERENEEQAAVYSDLLAFTHAAEEQGADVVVLASISSSSSSESSSTSSNASTADPGASSSTSAPAPTSTTPPSAVSPHASQGFLGHAKGFLLSILLPSFLRDAPPPPPPPHNSAQPSPGSLAQDATASRDSPLGLTPKPGPEPLSLLLQTTAEAASKSPPLVSVGRGDSGGGGGGGEGGGGACSQGEKKVWSHQKKKIVCRGSSSSGGGGGGGGGIGGKELHGRRVPGFKLPEATATRQRRRRELAGTRDDDGGGDDGGDRIWEAAGLKSSESERKRQDMEQEPEPQVGQGGEREGGGAGVQRKSRRRAFGPQQQQEEKQQEEEAQRETGGRGQEEARGGKRHEEGRRRQLSDSTLLVAAEKRTDAKAVRKRAYAQARAAAREADFLAKQIANGGPAVLAASLESAAATDAAASSSSSSTSTTIGGSDDDDTGVSGSHVSSPEAASLSAGDEPSSNEPTAPLLLARLLHLPGFGSRGRSRGVKMSGVLQALLSSSGDDADEEEEDEENEERIDGEKSSSSMPPLLSSLFPYREGGFQVEDDKDEGSGNEDDEDEDGGGGGRGGGKTGSGGLLSRMIKSKGSSRSRGKAGGANKKLSAAIGGRSKAKANEKYKPSSSSSSASASSSSSAQGSVEDYSSSTSCAMKDKRWDPKRKTWVCRRAAGDGTAATAAAGAGGGAVPGPCVKVWDNRLKAMACKTAAGPPPPPSFSSSSSSSSALGLLLAARPQRGATQEQAKVAQDAAPCAGRKVWDSRLKKMTCKS